MGADVLRVFYFTFRDFIVSVERSSLLNSYRYRKL